MPGTIGAGLAGQVGIADQSVPGTPVAATVFTKYNTETIDRRPNDAQGVGLGGDLVPLASRRIEVSHDAGGPIEIDLPTKGLGKWLKACFGSGAAVATQIAATPAYQQIHNMGSSDGYGFTLQKGVPQIGGTVDPYTLDWCKVTDWTLTLAPNAIAKLQMTIDALDILPVGAGPLALQTASYTAANGLFSFKDLTVSTFAALTVVSGVWTPTTPSPIANVRQLVLKGGQPKDTARWIAGQQTKGEQLINDFQPITATLDVDYSAANFYSQFAANTSSGFAINLTGAVISGSNKFALNMVCPAGFFESGATAKVTGPGIVTVSYPMTFLSDGVNGAFQAVHISTDTTV